MECNIETILERIKSHDKYNVSNFSGKFPNPSKLIDKPHQHLYHIVEQAEKVLETIRDEEKQKNFIGVLAEDTDLRMLIDLIIKDTEQFNTESGLNFLESAHFAQNTLPSNTLFNLARSYILADTYKHIELLNQKEVYEIYSIPFIIRLAIEKKLKAIIGFNYSITYFTDKTKRRSEQFPAGKVINFLKNSDLVSSPLSFDELKKIYNWSCQFVHTGNKEYIWIILKALDCLEQLFSNDNHHDGYLGVDIVYLNNGVTLSELEKAINDSNIFNNIESISATEERFELHLSEENFDMTNSFYDIRKRI